MSLKSSYVCDTCLHFWQTSMLVSWPPKIISTNDISGKSSALGRGVDESEGSFFEEEEMPIRETPFGCKCPRNPASSGVIVVLLLFLVGGGGGCRTLIIFEKSKN